MNVSDQWMLEKMQQMAASMTATLPQTGQNSEAPKTEKGETFQDLVNKAKDQKLEAPKKDSTAQKTDTVQEKAPAEKTESKVITNMRDPRIQALDRETQAQIAAGFLTPVETSSGDLLLKINCEPSAIITPLLPNGQPDLTKPIVLVNSSGEQFEVYLDQENGNHKLFQVTEDGGKQQIDLFPEQPKMDILGGLKNLDMTVTTLQEAMTQTDAGDEDETDLGTEVMTAGQPLFKDVKAAPVKVGENFQLDTQEPDMDAQLADTIQQAAQQGLKQIEIKLSPENLGNLTIKLTQNSDGTLQVILHATNMKAADLLNQHLDSLHLALQGLNQSEVHVEVQRNEDSQQAEQHFQQADPDGHNQQQQQHQQHRQEQEHSQDFIQRLRLGLFQLEDII